MNISSAIKKLAMKLPQVRKIVSSRDQYLKELLQVKEEYEKKDNELDKMRSQYEEIKLEKIDLKAEVVAVERELFKNELENFRLTNKMLVLTLERDRLRNTIKNSKKDRTAGYCHCCREETYFEIQGNWLRDGYLCSNCFSIPRQRHLQYILDQYFSGWEEKKIHESSPSNYHLSQYCRDYSISQYFPDIPLGSDFNEIRCENLESLTFDDDTFDIFITQDVLEHVFNPKNAAKEIIRVLKPGGVHIFTAPRHKKLIKSYPRAAIVESGIEYYKPAVYHGNPIGDGKTLVTWDYGDDFEYLLQEWTGKPVTTFLTKDRGIGLDGEYLEVFVVRKL